MRIPFTVEQFFSIFKVYNEAIWPAQIVAYLMGLALIVALFKQTKWSGRFITGVLTLFWVWMGVTYHLLYFSTINPAARLFGILFIVQGILFAMLGVILNRLEFGSTDKLNTFVGGFFILFSMLIYPILGYAFGHNYPAAPMFGVAPCPVTIFTFGVFLFAQTKIQWYLFLLPLLWSLVGISAAISLQVPQDYGLVFAGIFGTALILKKNRRISGRSNQSLNQTP